MLTRAEVECLFRLGQFNERDGVIVEIGSWKGKSTAAFGRGAASAHADKVSTPSFPIEFAPKRAISKIPKPSFSPILNTSVSTITRFHDLGGSLARMEPPRTRALDRRRPPLRSGQARLHFVGTHLVEGAIVAMHDTIRKKSPKRVLWESVFRSGRFQEIAIVDNITTARKVRRASPTTTLRIYRTLGLRALYIATRKSSIPHSREVGRKLLRRLTAQSWPPVW